MGNSQNRMGLLQHIVPYNRLVIILTLIVPLTHILLPLSSEAQLVNSSTPAAIIQQKYFNQILNHLVYLMQIGRLDGGMGLFCTEMLILHMMTLGDIVPKVKVVLSGF